MKWIWKMESVAFIDYKLSENYKLPEHIGESVSLVDTISGRKRSLRLIRSFYELSLIGLSTLGYGFYDIGRHPSGHTTLKWRRSNVDATWSRRIDVDTTSFWCCLPAGMSKEVMFCWAEVFCNGESFESVVLPLIAMAVHSFISAFPTPPPPPPSPPPRRTVYQTYYKKWGRQYLLVVQCVFTLYLDYRPRRWFYRLCCGYHSARFEFCSTSSAP